MTWKKGESGNPNGRKKSAIKAATEALVQKALDEGTTPLQVMLEAMRQAYQEGGAQAAVPFAKEAAPYVHPKLSNIDAKLDGIIDYYTAQPIPVETRNTDTLASAERPATNGHSS